MIAMIKIIISKDNNVNVNNILVVVVVNNNNI